MRIGNHSLCGVWCFLTDKETEAFFGPAEKMLASASFQSGSNLEVIWKSSIPCPKGLNKLKLELFIQMIRNESKKKFIKVKVCVQHIGPLVSFEVN